MAVPIVDGIDFNTMAYTPVYGADSHFSGIFEWGFFYKEKLVPQRELNKRKHMSEPYRLVNLYLFLCISGILSLFINIFYGIAQNLAVMLFFFLHSIF